MTVHTLSSQSGPFNGDGVRTIFPFFLTIFDAKQLIVTRTNIAGHKEILTEGVDYMVRLNADQGPNPGGEIEYLGANGPMPIGEAIHLKRVVDLLQETDLQSLGGYPPIDIEQSLDKLTMITQQLTDEVTVVNGSVAATIPTRFAVLGASETVFPWQQTWINLINGAFQSEGLNVEFYHTGAGAVTHHLAMSEVDSLTGETRVELTSNSDPDVIIVELGINDAILALGSRSQNELIADAQALYGYFRDNNPNALILYSRLIPYDEERHGKVATENIKKKYCVPFMHQTSSMPGEANLYTSEYAALETVISSTMQDRLNIWKALDAECQNLADVTINTSYFRAARLGLLSHDRFHPNSLGHYFIMSRVWKAFQTDATIRAATPELTKIRSLGDFTDFDLLWSSAIKLDAGGDGYDVDPDFLSGWEYPMWLNIYADTNIIYGIKYWANQQRPTIDVSEAVNKSNDDIFLTMMNDLWPELTIETKLWVEGGSEPSTWNSASPSQLTSSTGGHISAVQNISLTNGIWLIKYKIGDDVFGPFSVNVFGTYPLTEGSGSDVVTLVRTNDQTIASAGWHNIILTDSAIIREINDAPSAVLTSNDGEVRIPDNQGFSRFRMHGFCTLVAASSGVYRLSFYRSPTGYQHDRASGNTSIDPTSSAEPIRLTFDSMWLPIQPGGETIYFAVYTPAGAVIDAGLGIGLQIELR
ncbi:MAG: hypothetical protein KZQ91_08155 [Candidatus Thiodiazotropha sp. (ex Lucinoma borealis)]|nr:hypothetical protein [Candidatus Thiodiazotropha sp. (ex Lucinoma borealis)]